MLLIEEKYKVGVSKHIEAFTEETKSSSIFRLAIDDTLQIENIKPSKSSILSFTYIQK